MLKLRKQYKEMFPGQVLVGISWRSGNRDTAAIRSIELPYWEPILKTPGFAFINLQYGEVARDLALVKSELGIDILVDETINPLGSMDPFAAQIAALDLVISVDNSTIHFAGALGKTTWAMLPINSDWRWLTDRREAIWYSSLELFRQQPGKEWSSIVNEIADRLRTLAPEALEVSMTALQYRCAKHAFEHGRLDVAEEYYRALLVKGQHHAEALHAIGVCAREAGHAKDAVSILAGALELAPTDIVYKADLAVALDLCGESDRAFKLGRDALRQDGSNRRALLAMGRILTHRGRLDEATDYFARVLRAEPAHVESRTSLARAQAGQGEWQLARQNFTRAISYAPLDPVPHIGLAEAALRLGDFAVGWKHFRWRFGSGFALLPPHLAMMDPDKQPDMWEEGHLRRARLYLRAECNIIDQILFSSFLPEIIKETRSVLSEISPNLLPLMRMGGVKADFVGSGEVDAAVIAERKIGLASSLGDLAARYRLDAGAFPAKAAWLTPDKERVNALRADYHECFPGRRIVGLTWRQAGTGFADAKLLAPWRDLLARPDIGIVALQIGADVEQMTQFASETGYDMIHDRRVDPNADLVEYANQIAAVDLVVAVEDLSAILAAALGKPVWKLATGIEHWCWGAAGDRTVWASGARVLRSPTVGHNLADLVLAAMSRGQGTEWLKE